MALSARLRLTPSRPPAPPKESRCSSSSQRHPSQQVGAPLKSCRTPRESMSGRQDLNLRSPAPKAGALNQAELRPGIQTFIVALLPPPSASGLPRPPPRFRLASPKRNQTCGGARARSQAELRPALLRRSICMGRLRTNISPLKDRERVHNIKLAAAKLGPKGHERSRAELRPGTH